MNDFTQSTLLEINNWLERELQQTIELSFVVFNPDNHPKAKGYKIWVNLAELHFCKMLTPQIIDEDKVKMSFKKLQQEASFHLKNIQDKKEKYGKDSLFFEIQKNEEPTFLLAYKRALEAVKVQNRKHILNLGINKGDEFELIQKTVDKEDFEKIKFSGIDHSQTALNFAKERFPQSNVTFYQHDINELSTLNLEKADLIVSIGTLQSPEINYKPFLMSLVQKYLSFDGAFILGFPNGRWMDNELIYGAKAPNYPYSEMSLLYNDVIFAKKYLQQKKFRVTITGREYIFLTATRIGI